MRDIIGLRFSGHEFGLTFYQYATMWAYVDTLSASYTSVLVYAGQELCYFNGLGRTSFETFAATYT